MKVFPMSNATLTLLLYIVAGSTILSIIIFGSYIRLGILNTGLLLGGYDSPEYAWSASTIIRYGPFYYMNLVSYFQLYTLVLAFFGYLIGSVIWAQRILPVILGIAELVLVGTLTHRLTNRVHVAGIAILLTPILLATLWLVGESHRNFMAYDFALLTVLVTAGVSRITISKAALVSILLFITIATEFEMFAVLSLSLLFSCLLQRNWRLLGLVAYSSLLAIAILVAAFPSFFYVNYLQQVSNIPPATFTPTFSDLVFWSVGSILVLPIAALGFATLLGLWLSGKSSNLAILVFAFSTLLIGMASAFVAFASLPLSLLRSLLADRTILLAPIPVLLALGIWQSTRIIEALNRLFATVSERASPTMGSREKTVWGVVLTSLVAWGAVMTGSSGAQLGSVSPIDFITGIIMQPHVNLTGYETINIVKNYLESKSLQNPVFIFDGNQSLGVSDQYRRYIGTELGDHLAYFGTLENLLTLRPTNFTNPVATFYSNAYLQDMFGNRTGQPPYPEKTYVRNATELGQHPLVIVVPEFYDALIPQFYANFSIAKGIYVIPRISEIATLKIPMVLQEGNNSETLQADPTTRGGALTFRANASSFRLSGWPNYLNFSGLSVNGTMVNPEASPMRPNGSSASDANDPTSSLNHWRIFAATYNATKFQLSSTVKVSGNGSLNVSGPTDPYGNLAAVYEPGSIMNFSGDQTLSFWGLVSEPNTNWILLLRDQTGHQASYWKWNYGLSASITSAQAGHWERLVTNLTQPTTQDSGFDMSRIQWVAILVYTGHNAVPVSFYINDLTVDKYPNVGQTIFKRGISQSDKITVFFNLNK